MSSRRFEDSEGRTWQAWDVQPSQHPDWPVTARRVLPDAMADGWLCFESGALKRRLHPIPRGWESWSEDELRMRCRLAAPVGRSSGSLQAQPPLQ